ncbi:MAG TPA: hypothetical protein VIJ68_01490 [Candidatus Saccharimonadales bacterium]
MALNAHPAEVIAVDSYVVEPIMLGQEGALSPFEQTSTAITAVREVFGMDYLLRVRSSDNSIPLAFGLEGRLQIPFEGKAAFVIRTALEEVAHDDDSPWEESARTTLDIVADPAPARKDSVVESHLSLGTFEHVVTALEAVREFKPEEDTMEEEREIIIAKLQRTRDEFSWRSEEAAPVFYWGEYAEIIYEGLAAAAAQRQTYLHESAAHMLGLLEVKPEPVMLEAAVEPARPPIPLPIAA